MNLLDVLRELADTGAASLLRNLEWPNISENALALRLVCRSARDFVDVNITEVEFCFGKKDTEKARGANTPLPILSRWLNCSSVAISLVGYDEDLSEDLAVLLTLPFIGLSSVGCKRFVKLSVGVLRFPDVEPWPAAHAISLLLPRLTGLRTLQLYCVSGLADGRPKLLWMYDTIADLTHLQTLSLPHPGALEYLPKLSTCTSLRQLEIRYPHKHMRECLPLDVGSLLRGLSSLTSLRELAVWGVGLKSTQSSQPGQAGGDGGGGAECAQLQALLSGLPTGLEVLRLDNIDGWGVDMAFSLEQQQLLQVELHIGPENFELMGDTLALEYLATLARKVLLPLLRPRPKLRRLVIRPDVYNVKVLDDGDMAVLRELVSRCEEAPRMPSLLLDLLDMWAEEEEEDSYTVEAQVRAAEQAIEVLGRPGQLLTRWGSPFLYETVLDPWLSSQQPSSEPPPQPLPSAAGLLALVVETAAAQPQRAGRAFLLRGPDVVRLFGKEPLPDSGEHNSREPESTGAGDDRADLGGPSLAGEVPGEDFMRSLLRHLDKQGASALTGLHFTVLPGAEPSVLMELSYNWALAREAGKQDNWLADEVAEAARAAAVEVSGQSWGWKGAEDARIRNRVDGIDGRLIKALQAVWDRDFSATDRGRQPLTAELIPWLLRLRKELALRTEVEMQLE